MNGETEKIWYIFDKGIVSGPFIQDEVKMLASSPACLGNDLEKWSDGLETDGRVAEFSR